MSRWAQVLLLLPVLVLVALRWRTGRMPTVRLLFAALMGMVLVGAALAWFGSRRALTGGYVPAQLHNGQVVAGHGAAPP
jgi:hypothetical protein